jgi:hypothetical protein
MVQMELLSAPSDLPAAPLLPMAAVDSISERICAQSPIRPLRDALSAIFPTAEYDTQIEHVRRTMRDEIADVSDQDLGTHLTELQCLIDSWMDDFERSEFNGKTLIQYYRGR